MSDSNHVIVQVKAPVTITLKMKREDAEWMYKDELCRIVDQALEDISSGSPDGPFPIPLMKDKETLIECAVNPYWNLLPENECEITYTESGLFPERDEL